MEHWADARPAWLWSGDGSQLLWRNGAARYFNARSKKNGPKLLASPAPIKGQVARLIRLGSLGRASLSRIQFLAGEKPISATCSVTPLTLADGSAGLLVVAVDPIAGEFLADAQPDALTLSWLPPESQYLLLDNEGAVLFASPEARALGEDPTAELGEGMVALGGTTYAATRFPAGPKGENLVLLEPTLAPAEEEEPGEFAESVSTLDGDLATPPAESDLDAWAQADGPDELPGAAPETGFDPQWAAVEVAARATLEAPEDTGPAEEPPREPEQQETSSEESATSEGGRLSGLFERLAHDAELYAPLSESDEGGGSPEPQTAPAPVLLKVIGRGFVPLVSEQIEAPAETTELPGDEAPPNEVLNAAEAVAAGEAIDAAVPAAPPPADAETVERVSRYNFDELSRILNDRVSGELGPQTRRTTIEEIITGEQPAADAPATPAATGSLINLGGETLVLNRLPLGILVFRDQQVLFANRAITEMIGYDSVESLRAAGLGAIFPSVSDDKPEAGPVNHLMQRDGTLVPVTARLQSISWQGKPALMLSASATEVRTGHEGAVRAFAELTAETHEDGFIEATRAGVISAISAFGRIALQKSEQQLVGRPLSEIVDRSEHHALRTFLERPARFAETARPVLVAKGAEPGLEVMLFAQGQAGIVTGYFGFLRRRDANLRLPPPAESDNDPALMGRLSRGLRRPLNTIIGFADLIGSAAFGDIGNPRYQEYAKDIKSAGQEITALVDELDDFTRLRDGRYAPRPSDVDLAALLESCVIRVRGQANAARVLVRSAISERLPRIRADRASLGQAVLNLLASAIDQTPIGGAVVLSAKLEEDGSIAVHVRDSANQQLDRSETFVVFRDGVGKDGELLTPVRSTVGLALTRSLLAVNACSLSVDPAGGVGTLFSMVIPSELVTREALPSPATPRDS